jgi:methylenetetrahydrofolate reductase (NADPH)
VTDIQNDDDSAPSGVHRLMENFSVEVTPKETTRSPRLAELLPSGTAVYITFLPGAPWADTVDAARRALAEGMRPVPHLAARAIPDANACRGMLEALTDIGVHELMLVAGSRSEPVGAFRDSLQVLRSGLLEEAGITRVGVCGHPEGNRDIGDAGLRSALAEKNAVARVLDLDLYLVTQFCFSPGPIVEWERRIRDEGNTLPIKVGLPGVTSPARLLRFGLSCGVGPSLQVLRKQSGNMSRLAAAPAYRPDRTLEAVARASTEPGSRLRGIHFFPFGSLAASARWALTYGEGGVDLPEGVQGSA